MLLGSFSSSLCVLGQGVISCSSGWAGGITRMDSFGSLEWKDLEMWWLWRARSTCLEHWGLILCKIKTRNCSFQLRVSMQWMHLQPGMLDLLPHGLGDFLYLWNKVKSVPRQAAKDRRNRLFSPALRWAGSWVWSHLCSAGLVVGV